MVIKRAARNRTITLAEEEKQRYVDRLVRLDAPAALDDVLDRTICQDLFVILDWLPESSVDLLFADPPYNLSKTFKAISFGRMSLHAYEQWLKSWLVKLARVLKPNASLYICGDWRSSAAIHRVLEDLFVVRNRITWEREKGRGAKRNWKNNAEDIWFATVSDDYTFNVEEVKLMRRVIAPYRDAKGHPKDWVEVQNDRFRLTHPSNIWTDITVPFWSMPENTDHPTQKPEKLLAKIILASSNEGDVILDPFLGSGTTSVVAKKLNRHWIGIEIDEYYCCLAEKRLDLATREPSIQGYANGVFWERNTLAIQRKFERTRQYNEDTQASLFNLKQKVEQ
ncbi:MAG: site-specific DNA-methyltransferase [Chloroflexi bacterium]|nr:site-specific DNA-methyltransferase [Chloroflexota bacterium]